MKRLFNKKRANLNSLPAQYMFMKTRKQQAKLLRQFRKIHRYTGAFLFVFFIIVSLSGLFLGWKSHSFGVIIPETQRGTTYDLSEWLKLEKLQEIAVSTLKDSIDPALSPTLDRIDIRQQKGIVKFVFEQHIWEIQLDGATGKVLQIGKRHSDWLEDVHDGSIIDQFFDTQYGQFKLFYTSTMGMALLVFSITGFWMWYGPKHLRKTTRKHA